MINTRRLFLYTTAGMLAGALAGLPAANVAAQSSKAPGFRVDADWPKPLPNNWIMGQVAGIAVDRHDNIWIVQRPRSLSSSEAGALGQFDDATNDEDVPINALGQERPFGPISDCCLPAPSVMQFDPDGNLLQAWGGPADEGYLGSEQCNEDDGCFWPANEHGIYVDHNLNVYLAGNGSGDGEFPWDATHGEDGHVLKFSADGTHLLTVGGPLPLDAEAMSNDTSTGLNGTPQLYNPADTEVDHETNELYIADGYGNHRVVVVDAETGEYKRHWGAYGQKPVDDALSDTAPEYGADPGPEEPEIIPFFRNPVHCVHITHRDDKVYVCDRVNDRIQVFDKKVAGTADCSNLDGTEGECGFLQEEFIRADTLGPGSVWDLSTSPDPWQTCVHNADGTNQQVDTLWRKTLKVLDSFGRGGRNAGQFHWVHNVATDSHGNIYTAEVDTGKRAQKFDRVGRPSCRG